MYNYIIVGQGIAGSCLAITLIKKGFTVCVIDKPNLSSSSKVAAGIWNPVVFKRLTKSWLADDVVPHLINFYSDFETETNSKFLYHKKIIKPFFQEQEKKLWLQKSVSENKFLDPTIYNNFSITNADVLAENGAVLQAGNIDVVAFLNESKLHIKKQNYFIEDEFDYNALIINKQTVSYKTVTATRIIFCEGYLIKNNAWFNFVPMKPAKGEVLTIECDQLKLTTDILNKGLFILPIGNNKFKVGATYEWHVLNDEPTILAKMDIEEKLQQLISVPYKVIKHEAGVRPAVIDRRPVIGVSNKNNNCYAFNGFGTKAVMLAPYFANHFCEHLTNELPLNAEVDCNRFIKK